MNTAHICLGGNSDGSGAAIRHAAIFLASTGEIVADSGIFRSEAEWCPDGTPLYLNEVIALATPLSAPELQRRTKAYEYAVRRLYAGHGVILDIDIVQYNSDVLRLRDYGSGHYRRGMALLGIKL